MITNRSLNHFPLENPTTIAPTRETRPAEFIGSRLALKVRWWCSSCGANTVSPLAVPPAKIERITCRKCHKVSNLYVTFSEPQVKDKSP